jgi:hypothetical protein
MYICDGCIWFVACHKTQKAKMHEMKLLTVIGRGHKTLMHSGAAVVVPLVSAVAFVVVVVVIIAISNNKVTIVPFFGTLLLESFYISTL